MSAADERRFRRAAILILMASLTILFAWLIREFLVPLFLGAVFANLAAPLDAWFERRLKRPSIAAIATIVVLILVAVIPLVLLLTMIADQAFSVSENMVPWIQEQVAAQRAGQLKLPAWLPFSEHIETAQITEKLGQLGNQAGAVFMSSLTAASKGTAEFFLGLFVMLYAMYNFFLHGPTIRRSLSDAVPLPETTKKRLFEKGRSVARATLKGTIVIGLIQGVLGGLALQFAGIPAAALWGAVMAVASVIPAIGTALVWIPACAYLILTGETGWGFGLLAYFALVVGSVDNVLRPSLVGNDTQLPDLLILVSTLGGLQVFGMAGLLLGPMIAAFCVMMLDVYKSSFHDELDQ